MIVLLTDYVVCLIRYCTYRGNMYCQVFILSPSVLCCEALFHASECV